MAENNYTPEQTEELKKAYVAAKTDEERKAVVNKMAEELGKSVSSVRAKLVREGVYVAINRVSKVTGGKPRTKEQLVEDLEQAIGAQQGSMESLAKASKLTILKILEYVNATGS